MMDSKQPGNLCYSDKKKDNKKCINGMSKIFVKSYSGLVNIFILLDNDSVRVSKYRNFKKYVFLIWISNFKMLFFGVVFVLYFMKLSDGRGFSYLPCVDKKRHQRVITAGNTMSNGPLVWMKTRRRYHLFWNKNSIKTSSEFEITGIACTKNVFRGKKAVSEFS